MDLKLKDKVAVVTGGASGIGLATARLFATEGANLFLWDRSDSVVSVAQELNKEFGVNVTGIKVDVTDSVSVQDALKNTLVVFNRVDHLVHCAATGSGKFGFPFTNLEPSDWLKVLNVNIIGMVNIAHAIAPVMMNQKEGTMVFIASVAGQMGSQTDPPYSASKAANINFAQCLAKDLALHQIRVNTVCPGMVQTPLNQAVWKAWLDKAAPADKLGYEEWSQKKINALVPLGKWQTVDTIADMIVFLSSYRAGHVTGQTINVDGGFVMHC
ncbi:MAG: SDR family oxidoreductase [Planctomycetes bacterium]|nr:SDR family oxidoreductase [Planctomycetota bacterium]